MEEKAAELPTQRCKTAQYPQLQLETRRQCAAAKVDQADTFTLDRSNDEITLFNAELRSSCDVTGSSCLNVSSTTDSLLRQQILDLQRDKRKQQQVSISSRGYRSRKSLRSVASCRRRRRRSTD